MKIQGVIFMVLFLCVTVQPAFAESPGSLISAGNSAWRNGNYDSALKSYNKASVDVPESPLVNYNKGTAFYMKGEYQKAADLFAEAARKAKDLIFEARCQFNMGNSRFRESQRQADSDLQKSMKALQTSIGHFQKALRLDPKLKEAAQNLEVARLTLKNIMDQIKKQQEKAKQQQKQQQSAGKNKEPSKKQQTKKEQQKQSEKSGKQKQPHKKGERGQQNQQSQQHAQKEKADGKEQKSQEKQASLQSKANVKNILNEEQENKERRQVKAHGGYQPVEKDW